MIKSITIEGYKSIRKLQDFELKNLNVIIGANAAGKSNFISFLKMVKTQLTGDIQSYIRRYENSMEHVAFMGTAVTPKVNGKIVLDSCTYGFSLASTESGGVFFEDEYLDGERGGRVQDGCVSRYSEERWNDSEKVLALRKEVTGWSIYHLNDTSLTARVKKDSLLVPGLPLTDDFSNLASWLHCLRGSDKHTYEHIVFAVNMVFPAFQDFFLQPTSTEDGVEYIRLFWKQKNSNITFSPSHFSDGTLRFLCLCAALMQPHPPTTIVIDEHELCLHPEAIRLLAELLQSAAATSQVIVATQSPLLLDQFAVEDIIVVRRQDGASTFERLKEQDYSQWFDDYTIGELWTKNVIEGGTVYE